MRGFERGRNPSGGRWINAQVLPLAMAGRFKQTNGAFKIYIQPLADVTSSGIQTQTWIERALRELNARKVVSGPMFRRITKAEKVQRALIGDLNVMVHGLWKRIQHRRPDIIPDSIKIEDDYSARRSFRRGATTEAQNRKIP